MIIRQYQVNDKAVLKNICCDLAHLGRPIDCFLPNRKLAAQMLLGYYIQYEPEHIWVLVDGQEVVGYITGCMNNRHFGLITFFVLTPQLIGQIIIQGVLLQPWFWKLVPIVLSFIPRLFQFRKRTFERVLGHCHIGVQEKYQHQGFAKQLLNTFLNQAKINGCEGISVSVNNLNTDGINFFKRMGFIEIARNPGIGFDGQKQYHYEALLLVYHFNP